jgi:L-lactate dehydrogenase (cytochrome)
MATRGLLTYADRRRAASRRLPRLLFDYVDGGSFGEVTLRSNENDFTALRLKQRVLRDMSSVRMDIRLFGDHLTMPVILGPVGFAGMYAKRGERLAAAAARDAGILFSLSSVGICSVEEVATHVVPPWFQLYMIRDRSFMRDLLHRAWSAGSRVLLLTADLPTPAPRHRDARSGMTRRLGTLETVGRALDGMYHPAWLWNVFLRGRPHCFGNLAGPAGQRQNFVESWAWITSNFDRSVSWKDIDFVRSEWPGTIVIKGVMEPDDARRASDAGADAVVVSNHGGRQLDGVASSISALPAMVEAVGGRMPVLMDGGIRSGLDVLKALASGATACLLGRAWIYALAAGGQEGVAQMLAQMHNELETAMVLSGCNDVAAAREVLSRAAS